MSRKAVFLAGGIAAAVVCAAIAAVLRGGLESSATADILYSLQSLEARLDRLEERLESRLGDLENDLRMPSSSPAPLFPMPSDEQDPGDRGVEAVDSPADPDAAAQLDKILARLDDFEFRIRGLEEDPVERGYAFLQSSNFELRRQGIFTLERIAKYDPQARLAIREMLQDADGRVRLAALDTLADIGDKESVAWIQGLLSDEDANVRRETIETLARLGAQQSGGEIATLIKDGDPRVRERVADVLGRLKYQEGMGVLLQALGDSNEEVRGQAIASLGEIGAKNAIPALRELYEKNPGRQRFRLVSALKSLGDGQPFQQEVNRISKTALEDENESARRDAVRTLAWFARDQAKDVLEQAAKDPSERVRREAERALHGWGERRRR